MASDIGGAISSVMPSMSGFGSGLSTTLFWIFIFIVVVIFLVAGGIGVFYLVRYLQFNKKIDIYEERNGMMEKVGTDRAREIKYNIYGDSVFILRKRKKYLPRGEMKSGRNFYLYCIRADGEWVNIAMGSVNKELKESGVKFIHPDMRAFKSGLSQIMENRFEKKNWIKEYGPIIFPIIIFIIMALAIYFIADKVVSGITLSNNVMGAADKVLDRTNDILSSLNNICSNSGMRSGG